MRDLLDWLGDVAGSIEPRHVAISAQIMAAVSMLVAIAAWWLHIDGRLR